MERSLQVKARLVLREKNSNLIETHLILIACVIRAGIIPGGI
jgi:hypothetical protein